MLSIGDFARLGRVSVRMLRHYDGIGLLVPARVDPSSGYRWYDAAQLARLDRVVALKDLGFTLEQTRSMVDDEVSVEQLQGMLRLRRAELVAQIRDDQDRLARVERRLRSIESEETMSDRSYTLTALPAQRLVAITAEAASMEHIAEVVGPNFAALASRLAAAGFGPVGPAVASYYGTEEDGPVTCVSAFPADPAAEAVDGVEVVELPAAQRAVSTTYRGPMSGIADAWQALARHCQDEGLTFDGSCREVYLDTPMDDPDHWVTELQQPVR